MKRLLLISYHFPPIASIASLRPLRFVQQLPEYGWNCDVLTVANDRQYQKDNSLMREKPDNVTIYRANRLPIPKHMKWIARKVFGTKILWYNFVDDCYDWYPFATCTGNKILSENNYDAILATAPPYTSLRVARTLARKAGVPAVADLRDPFTQNSFIEMPTKIHEMVYTLYESKLLGTFNRILAAWPRIIEMNSRALGIPRNKFDVITNGFDEVDLDAYYNLNPPNDCFRIGYFGSIYGKRTLRPLFKALSTALRERPELRNHIELIIAGSLDEKELGKLIENYDCSSVVKYLKQVRRKSALQIMSSCHLLTLVSGTVMDSFPGKLFDYMACRRPVMSFGESGFLAKLLEKTKLGCTFDENSIRDAALMILELYDRFNRGEDSFDSTRELIQTYNSRIITGRLASILDKLVDG
jgi:glycosyltransferase involved in cell wall biosynthesis